MLLKSVTATAHTNVYAGHADKHRCTRLECVFINSVNLCPSAVTLLTKAVLDKYLSDKKLRYID